jgi:hypothetical protein
MLKFLPINMRRRITSAAPLWGGLLAGFASFDLYERRWRFALGHLPMQLAAFAMVGLAVYLFRRRQRHPTLR